MDDITDSQRAEAFKKLPQELRHSILKEFRELITDNIADRMKTLPTIGSLLATLLIVATFNQQLLPLNTEVKILISVVMLLIPISLFFYLINLIRAEENGFRYMSAYMGKSDISENLAAKTTIYSKIVAKTPMAFTVVIFLLINDILKIMWGCGVAVVVLILGMGIFHLFGTKDFENKQ